MTSVGQPLLSMPKNIGLDPHQTLTWMDILTYFPTATDNPSWRLNPDRSRRVQTMKDPSLRLDSSGNDLLSHSITFSAKGADLKYGRRARTSVDISTGPITCLIERPSRMKAGSAEVKLGDFGLLTKIQENFVLPYRFNANIPIVKPKHGTDRFNPEWQRLKSASTTFRNTVHYIDAETGEDKMFEPELTLVVSRFLPHNQGWD